MSTIDETLKRFSDAWEAVARYRVIRDERGMRTTLARGQTLREARALQERETAVIEAAPGYRTVMSRALVLIELENKAEALARCQSYVESSHQPKGK